jgi:hypothetical protein
MTDDFTAWFQLGALTFGPVEYRRGYDDCDAGWHAALRPLTTMVAKSRTEAEIVAAREFTNDPCIIRCQKCSRCIRYAQWWRNGKRDFLGIEAETALAQRAGRQVAA